MNKLFFSLLSWWPGALGILFRQKIFPFFFKKCGKDVLFGQFLTVCNPGQISIGNGVVISNNVTMNVLKGEGRYAEIIIEDNVFIGTDTKLIADKQTIKLLTGANLSSECLVEAKSIPVKIGSDTLIAAYCNIGDCVYGKDKSVETEPVSGSLTNVGARCWIGARATVHPGIDIGKESVIGAHADVLESQPAYSVCIGRPARVLRLRV